MLVSGPIASSRVGRGSTERTDELVGHLARNHRSVDERAYRTRAPARVARTGAHADELDFPMRGRAQERDRVVRVVTDVGVDPEPHDFLSRGQAPAGARNTARNAPSSSGCANS